MLGFEQYDDWFGQHVDLIGGGGATGGGGGWGGDMWGGSMWGAGFSDPYGGIGAGGGGTPGGGFPLPQLNIGFGGGWRGGSSAGPSINQTLTQIVDTHETQLKANLADFQNGAKSADGAISSGWAIMNSMVSACARYGVQGQKSAAERDRRINPAQLRWDWIAYYIDPITGGPSSLPPLPAGAGGGSDFGIGGIGGLDQNTLILLGVGILVFVLLKD